MTKDLDKLLDKCIDHMNDGESLEECLASYPEQAEGLRPLLQAMYNFRDACSPIPRAAARSVVRRRLDAALINSDMGLQKHEPRIKPFFGWARVWAVVAAALVLALIGFGLNWMLTPGVTPVVAQDNFRLLLSDEENDIGDFESLNVWVTSIGFLSEGESGSWVEFEPALKSVDLTLLQGDNALEIWSGQIPDGQYTKVFIYVDHVTGVLKGAGEVVIVRLPSERLQISMPFEVSADSLINFVYDITVIGTGNEQNEVGYVLKPQVELSGTEHVLNEVLPGKVDLSGPIEAFELVDGEGWVQILGLVVAIDEHNEIEGTIEVGHMAEVEAVVQPDDSLLATEIEVEAETEEEVEGASEVEIEGEIQDFELVNGEGWIQILGLVVAIDGNTDIDGIFEVGLMAEVDAVVQPDDSLLAVDIEVEEEEENEGASEVEIEGEIQDFELVNGEGWVQMLGLVVAIDENTKIDGTLGVGLMAEVDGVVQADDSLLATKIKVKDDEGATDEGDDEGATDEDDEAGATDEDDDADATDEDDEAGATDEDDDADATDEDDDEGATDEDDDEGATDEEDDEGATDEEDDEGDTDEDDDEGATHEDDDEGATDEDDDADATDEDDDADATDEDDDEGATHEDDDEGAIDEDDDEGDTDEDDDEGDTHEDDDEGATDEDDDEGDTHEDDEAKLTLAVVAGEVASGEEITVLVSFEGSPVEDGALVTVNDEEIGQTVDGLITFIVPDEDELDIEAVLGEMKGELEYDL